MKHILDLTKEELDTMSDEELNNIAWQSGMNINIGNARVAKLKELQKDSVKDILEGKE